MSRAPGADPTLPATTPAEKPAHVASSSPEPEPQPAPGAPIVETVTGTESGPLQFAADANGPAVLTVGAKAIPLGEVIFVRFAAGVPTPQAQPDPTTVGDPAATTAHQPFSHVVLSSGDELLGIVRGGDEAEVRLECASIGAKGGPNSRPFIAPVSLESIDAIAFAASEAPTALDPARRWIREVRAQETKTSQNIPANADDILLLTEGAELRGVLARIDSKAVQFQSSNAGEVAIPLSRVRAIALARDPQSRERPPGALKSSAISAVVALFDGGLLSGELLELSEGTVPGNEGADLGRLLLRHEVFGEVQIPTSRVESVRIRGGRCQFLSDLEPASVTHRADLFSPWPMRRDAAVTGSTLRLRGREHRKGLGMHSHCRAEYQLEGQYQRFQSILGMDDSARPRSLSAERAGAATAVFRAYVDGEVKLERLIRWSDPPVAVDLPLEGAKKLALELDYGPGSFVLDRGDWAGARVIKNS